MVIITMSMQNYVSWQTVVIGLISVGCLWKLKLSIPVVVLISAALGVLIVR